MSDDWVRKAFARRREPQPQAEVVPPPVVPNAADGGAGHGPPLPLEPDMNAILRDLLRRPPAPRESMGASYFRSGYR